MNREERERPISPDNESLFYVVIRCSSNLEEIVRDTFRQKNIFMSPAISPQPEQENNDEIVLQAICTIKKIQIASEVLKPQLEEISCREKTAWVMRYFPIHKMPQLHENKNEQDINLFPPFSIINLN